MSLFVNENPILGPLTQITWADGSIHNLAGDQSVNQAALSGNFQPLDSEPVINYQGSVAIGSGNRVAAVTGQTTIASGTTVTTGFVYGVQGRVKLIGSWTSSNFLAAVFGKLDFSAATAFTSGGPVQAIWGDMGGSITGSITTAANANIINLTNTTACLINAVGLVTAKASYFLDLNEVSAAGNWIVASAVGGSQDKKLKIRLNGTDYFIPCNTA